MVTTMRKKQYVSYIMINTVVFAPESNNLFFFGIKQAVPNIQEKNLLVIKRRYVLGTKEENIEALTDRTPLTSHVDSNKEYLFIKHAIPLMN